MTEPGRLCFCLRAGCGKFFRAPSPPSNYCPEHRPARVVPVEEGGAVRYVMEPRR
jgi:hypothetical protein